MEVLISTFINKTETGIKIQKIPFFEKDTKIRLIKPMVNDFEGLIYNPSDKQILVDLLQLILNMMSSFTTEDKLKLTSIYNLKQQLNNIPNPTYNIEYCFNVNCLDTLISNFVEDNSAVNSMILLEMELYDVDAETLTKKLINPMSSDLSKSFKLIANKKPQTLVDLFQLILNRIDSFSNEDQLKLTGIYNLKQQLNSIPHPKITFYDFYSHILNYWKNCRREPFKHPNGWKIELRLLDYLHNDATYNDFKQTATRVYFSYSLLEEKSMNCQQGETDTEQQDIKIEDEKLKKLFELSGIKFDDDDCWCGEFESLFEWFNANTPSVLLD